MSSVVKGSRLIIETPYKISFTKDNDNLNEKNTKRKIFIDHEIDNNKYYGERLINESYMRAQQIIKDAVDQKELIMQDCQKEIELAKKRGYEEGINIGTQKGFEAGMEKCRHIIDEAVKIKSKCILEKQNIIQESEKDIIGLSIKVVEKVLSEILDSNQEYVVNLVLAGLKKISEKKDIIIRCSDKYYETIKDQKENILKEIEGLYDIDIIKDPSLTTGECMIVSPTEKADVSIKRQLDIILKSLGGQSDK